MLHVPQRSLERRRRRFTLICDLSIPPAFCILFLTVYLSLFIQYLLSSPIYFDPCLPAALLHPPIFKYLLWSKGSECAENAINLNELLTIKRYNLKRWNMNFWNMKLCCSEFLLFPVVSNHIINCTIKWNINEN